MKTLVSDIGGDYEVVSIGYPGPDLPPALLIRRNPG